ncbi:MAG: hypothetical protein HS115_09135 [Spirochaetales bacterium]|nr:hypothetical protein [Spirochaetales bacterium]
MTQAGPVAHRIKDFLQLLELRNMPQNTVAIDGIDEKLAAGSRSSAG